MKKIKNLIKKIKKDLKGFTLVELLAVIVILAIIMVIAIPSVLGVMRSARVKSFINYGEKIVSNSLSKKLLEEVDYEEEGYTIIYDLDDLDFDNKGNYKAYVLVTVTEDGYSYKITLHDDEDMVIGYDYSKNKGMSNAKLETYDENDPKLTPEYLCSLSSSSTCVYKDKEIVNNNYVDVNDDTEEGFKNIAKIIADAADDKFKNSDYNNDLTKPACVLYDLEDLGFTNLGSYVAYAYVIPVDNNTRRIVLFLYNQYYFGGSKDYYTYGFESEDSMLMPFNEEMTYEMAKNELTAFNMVVFAYDVGKDSCFSLNYKGNYTNKDGETNDEEFWKKLNPEYSGEGGEEENPEPTPVDPTPTPETTTTTTKPSGSSSNVIYACGSGTNNPNATTASLCTGQQVNTALKKLANGDKATYENEDKTVKAIKFTNTKPSSSVKVANISPYNSKEVLAWLDGTTIYIYSSSNDINLNSDASYLFSNFRHVTSIDLSHFTTLNVTNMSDMFYFCTKVTSLDVSKFNTSNVTDMWAMFYHCESITSLDVSHFNTSNVRYMYSLFGYCEKLKSIDVSNFDTRNVTKMGQMFTNCKSFTSINISNFDTSKVTDMGWMFANMIGLTTLDVSMLDTSKVTDMEYMFAGLKVTSLDLSNFNTSNVTSMDGMFSMCDKLTSLNISSFNTSKVKSMYYMFSYIKLTSLDLRHFNTSSLTNTDSMFVHCWELETIDLSSFNTSKLTSSNRMFYCCYKLKNIYVGSGWDMSKVTNSSEMFDSATKLPNFNSKYIDKTKAFVGSGGYLKSKA